MYSLFKIEKRSKVLEGKTIKFSFRQPIEQVAEESLSRKPQTRQTEDINLANTGSMCC